MAEEPQEKARVKKAAPMRYVYAVSSALLVAWLTGLVHSKKILPCAMVIWAAVFCFISACYYDEDEPIKESERVVRFFGGMAFLVLAYVLISGNM
jgi:hypothetical protein